MKLMWLTRRIALFAVVAGAFLPGGKVTAADPAEVYDLVFEKVSATPDRAGEILKNELADLPPAERQRLASGVLAAVYRGLGKPDCDEIRSLFKIAVTASPRSPTALLSIAYQACPASAIALTKIAIAAVQAAGLPALIPSIVAQAIALDPDQRIALSQLAPPPIGEGPGEGGGLFGGPGTTDATLGAAEGSINPANIGGADVSPTQ